MIHLIHVLVYLFFFTLSSTQKVSYLEVEILDNFVFIIILIKYAHAVTYDIIKLINIQLSVYLHIFIGFSQFSRKVLLSNR